MSLAGEERELGGRLAVGNVRALPCARRATRGSSKLGLREKCMGVRWMGAWRVLSGRLLCACSASCLLGGIGRAPIVCIAGDELRRRERARRTLRRRRQEGA